MAEPEPLPTISWSPLAPGGANFCTRKLSATRRGTLRFKATIVALLFSFVFFTAGAAVLVFAPREQAPVLIPIFGTIFALVGLGLLAMFTKPIVFDRSRSLYYKGFGDPAKFDDKKRTQLGYIVAIQILAETVTRESSSGRRQKPYRSFELNLILKDGERIHVVDHGDLPQIKKDADTLGAYLQVPVIHPPGGKATDGPGANVLP